MKVITYRCHRGHILSEIPDFPLCSCGEWIVSTTKREVIEGCEILEVTEHNHDKTSN